MHWIRRVGPLERINSFVLTSFKQVFIPCSPVMVDVSLMIMDIEYWREKANKGLSAGLITMGECYLTGRGVEKNYAEAYRYLREAADKGVATGCYLLGIMFEEGLGVAQDIQQALLLYERAAHTNNPYALAHIARIYAEGKSGTKNVERALEIYRHIVSMKSEFDDPDHELLVEASTFITMNG